MIGLVAGEQTNRNLQTRWSQATKIRVGATYKLDKKGRASLFVGYGRSSKGDKHDFMIGMSFE